jgi:type II secretory ATPase GspE/PulE/Tfp pilus assembly ATPase PilB-like protein
MGAISRRQRMEILSLQTGLPFTERLSDHFRLLGSPFGQRTKTYLARGESRRRKRRHSVRLSRRVCLPRPLVLARKKERLAIPDPEDSETLRNLRVWKPDARILFYDFPPQAAARASQVPTEQAEGGLSSPVVDWLDEALSEGVRLGASDLHLVRESGVTVLRFRIHGRFRTGPRVPAAFQDAIVPRLKVMANMDVAEERLPQDGSFERRLSGYRQDFRVSVLPSVEGEGVVIRILGGRSRNEESTSGLDELDMPPILLESLRDWAQRRSGIILITGPTGSGKTSTLYSLLRELDRVQLKIVTLEDPVEYALDGAHQVQVNPEIGLSFAQGLRAILRHDPDVILVGEIRDRETAEIGLRASLTGHLVLSTLHTNSAVGAFVRLHDMGIPSYLTADAVLGVLAQRLVGRTCRACGAFDSQCLICHGAGIDGRVALFEGGPAEPLKDLIRTQGSEDAMKAVFRELGYPSLAEDARKKMAAGMIPEAELRAMGLWDLA